MKPHVLILGAGFGGVYAARRLRKAVKRGLIDVTIVNQTNYFLFTPLLHEVATGSLNARTVAEPLREIFSGTGIHFVQGAVKSIDTEKKIVTVNGRTEPVDIAYDHLVIATGATTNYYGIPGAEEHSMPLKNLMDAMLIRSKIIDAFEQAILVEDPNERKKLLSFAVVGGGATGVELTAELAEFICGMVTRYYSATNACELQHHKVCRPEEPTVTLVNATGELLEMFAPSLRKAAAARLARNGVIIRNNTAVTKVTPEGLETKEGGMIAATTVIWCAGVKPTLPAFIVKAPTLTGGRIAVDANFHMIGTPSVYVLGDAAAYIDPGQFAADSSKSKPLPMLAQVAIQQARIVADNILSTLDGAPLREFHYRSKGAMVSVGQWFAIGEIYSLNIAGRLTWWLWRTVYLFKFASWQKRIRIAIEWTLDFFYPRDITKLT